MNGTPLITIDNVVKHFDISGGLLDRLAFKGGKLNLERTTVKALNLLDQEIQQFDIPLEEGVDQYTVVARLMYRKVDQFLINFLLGEDSGLTAPVVEMTRITKTIDMTRADQQAERAAKASALPSPAGG